MVCQRCHTDNESGRRFCKECAEPLLLVCRACGTGNAADAKYCGQCAAPLSEAPPDPPVAQGPVAERRLVSVLFVDLVGFTTFAEGRDAEEVRDTLSRYFDVARGIIERYGGTVEKFIGDAVMAVWGAPVAHEDDAERAVRAALELVDAIKTVGPGIDARAGVLTGEAAVTVGATNQGMVAGDLVNTAARLQGSAPPGAVLVGESTQRATVRAIAYESVGEQQFKGKAAPVAAWRAVRVVAEVGGKNRSETLEAPFVGRDAELRMLKDLFHSTGRDRRMRLVSVTAPAGLGKSRLAWELSKYVDGLVEPVWWHAGRSPAYGEGITFWALGEMVRERAGLAETDDEATTRDRIAATVREWITDPEEQRWIEPALLALLGIEPISGGPEQLFGAWRTFFERISAAGTVTLIFEDLHWADPGTLDFIDHLTEWSRGVPIFVLTLARPELFDDRPEWASGRRNFSSITLEPLTEPSMRDLLAGLVPGIPQKQSELIARRAEGVPLYAVETVRMLVADGRLVRRESDGTYEPSGDLGDLAVPETLIALIAARIDSLEPHDRALVSDAAVLGHSFTPAGLAAISGLDEGALEARLRVLIRREILVLSVDPRSPERGQYAFVQALIREVAYNTISRRERRRRHLAAARFFESRDSDELAGALAGHLLAAHSYSAPGPEADAIAGQARIALRGAAARAASLSSHDQAVAFLEQALTVSRDASDEAELRELAGLSASNAGRHEVAEGYVRRALAIYTDLGDAGGVRRATVALSQALLLGNRIDATIALLEAVLPDDSSVPLDPGSIELAGELAHAMANAGRPARAIAIAEQVLEAAAEDLEYTRLIADTLITKGGAMADLGRSYEGIGLMRTGLEVARSADLRRIVVRALANMAASEIPRDPVAAIHSVRQGLVDARRLSLSTWVALLLTNGVEPALWTGDWQWATEEAAALLATDLDARDRALLIGAVLPIHAWSGIAVGDQLDEIRKFQSGGDEYDSLVTIHAASSHAAFASGRLIEAREHSHEYGRLSPINAPSAYHLAARAALWAGDLEGLKADLALLVGTRAHGPAISLHRSTFEAAIAAHEGRAVESLAMYREALRGWRDAGLPLLEALTAIDMAQVLDASLPDVSAALVSAREILARLGARPMLERVEAALRRQPLVDEPPEAPVREEMVGALLRPVSEVNLPSE